MGMNDLDRRERGTLFFAALFLLLAVFMLFYVPKNWGSRHQQARQQFAQAQQDLQLARLQKAEEELRVESQEELLRVLNARDPRFDLFPFINRMVTETGLSDRARLENGRRPRGLSENHPLVDLKLAGVSLEELTDLLHKVRGSNSLVAVYRMEIRPMLREQGLECDITFVSVKV
ncbi:MAG: hypothetical protein KF886_23170 [Candidatus Hydrogenedentes bacterium]|nr:hypothetical protein [Candidatus Hydrogenedentota bacterium]